MRIAHICQRDNPDTGGSLRVAEALAREQRAAGYEPWLVFLYGPPAQVSEEFGSHTVCLLLQSSKQAIKGIYRLCLAIQRIRPDVIHSHDGIVWPRLAFMQFRIPVVMHTHLPVAQSSHLWDRMLIRKTTRILIGISLHTIDTWVGDGFHPSHIHYVPNGVDFDRFFSIDDQEKSILRNRLGLPEKKRILLWVGRLHLSMKGSDRLERIANLMPSDMTLVVVGYGPEYQALIQRCEHIIADRRLIMIGSTATPEDYYQVADAFLFTSHHEPFGLVILEAVASGLPIYAFPVDRGGGAVSLLQEFSASMIEDEWTDEQIVKHLAAAPVAVDTMVSANRLNAKIKYSWRSISRRVSDVYELALNKYL